jgi:D-alanyl-lipoteichoic acid acyltransferase DltB (MBOAT superfamily)
LSWPLLLFLCSLLPLLALLLIAILTILTHEHMHVSTEFSFFFASVRKKEHRKTRKKFLFYILQICRVLLRIFTFLFFNNNKNNNNKIFLSQTSTAQRYIYLYIVVTIISW